jgi:hypothetical protein
MANERICIECGRPESEHCVFQAVPFPDGCVCHSDGSWQLSNIPKVCDQFTKCDDDSVCVRCEHDEACHKRVS